MNVRSPERPLATAPGDLPPLTVAEVVHRPVAEPDAVRSGDGPAVASFVLGLVGLLALNIVLGPMAIALATLAFVRGTSRRGRAVLGLTLGIADLIVLAALVSSSGAVEWSFG
ncbi:hypothetical protein [Streptomyces sp. Da 82-17]|uniref:hypothetical protein n=1 Tax=Streptomyces sp. Da 82-17 TaxID=3377116 RepID=UPI0038D4D90E